MYLKPETKREVFLAWEKTIVEKIMAKAAGKPEVSPGDYLKFGIKRHLYSGRQRYRRP